MIRTAGSGLSRDNGENVLSTVADVFAKLRKCSLLFSRADLLTRISHTQFVFILI